MESNDEIRVVSGMESSLEMEQNINRQNPENSESPQKDLDSKKERKSRWGDNEENGDVGSSPTDNQPTDAVIENLGLKAPRDNSVVDNIDEHQDNTPLVMTDALLETNVSDISQRSRNLKESTDLSTEDSDHPSANSQIVEHVNDEKLNDQGTHQQNVEMVSNYHPNEPIVTSQPMVPLNKVEPHHQLNGVAEHNVPCDPEAVPEHDVADVDNAKNSATNHSSVTSSSEAPCNDMLSENDAGSKMLIENHALEETQAAE